MSLTNINLYRLPAALALFLGLVLCAGLQATPRVTVPLDEGWSFRLGDAAETKTPDTKDGTWRVVDLPHDYVVEESFTAKDPFPGAASSRDGTWYPQHGSLPTRPAVYSRELDLSTVPKGHRLWLEFDGVFSNSRYFLNGREIGSQYSGYTRSRFDVTGCVDSDKKQVLTVTVDPRYDGWWYEGGGIYRHARLVAVAPVHISPDGVYVASTVTDPKEGKCADASVLIDTAVSNSSSDASSVTLVSEILDTNGESLRSTKSTYEIGSGSSITVKQQIPLIEARLWSVDRPVLYQLRSTVEVGGQAVDQVTTKFGVRKAEFDSEHGFSLNGKPLKLHGVNLHQDHAGVGVAVPDRLFTWRLERLKEVGCNAIRLSHNPVNPFLLDECDRLGFLVIAENRHLGDSFVDQSSRDVPAVAHRDLSALVQRDRNHPSIIAWSLCNEQWIQQFPESAAIVRAMRLRVHELDPSRPVTAAMNGGFENADGMASELDVIGINYNPWVYDQMHKLFPGKPMIATETASELGTRGIYATERWDSFVGDRARGYISSYGLSALAPDQPAVKSWPPVATREFIGGGFVWAGFDYKGEPKPFEWPCVSSQLGIMDSCGFPKDMYYYYMAAWTRGPVLHVFPHWNWAGREGQEIPVWVYTNCDEAELFLNGVSLGKKTVPPLDHLEWRVRYAPGRLVVKGLRGGVAVESMVETTGEPAGIRLSVDRSQIVADNQDLAVVNVEVIDAQGRVVPNGNNSIKFIISGPAKCVGVGNGDPASHESDKGLSRSAFNGLAQAIVQATRTDGVITVSAVSPGLSSAELKITSLPLQ